jgi:hypothetical protein
VTARDVDLLTHRLDTLTRAATRIRAHLADVHCLAFEATNHPADDIKVRTSKTDHTPKTGDPRARNVWDRLEIEIGRCEDILVGLERQTTGYFLVGSQSAEPSRGSLISAGEHDRLLVQQTARRRAGEYVPERLVPQHEHPGKGRQ